MIPILFSPLATNFTTNGLGRVADATYCHVHEERNGAFELEMDIPTTSPIMEHIAPGAFLYAQPRPGGAYQLFEISQISTPIKGIATVHAPHISYRLNKIIAMPYTASTCAAAITGLGTHAADDCPFTFGTDKSVEASFNNKIPTSIRALLGGQDGSILDVFGSGEYEFNNYSVFLHLHRGQNNGVTIRYGKNLLDLVDDKDTTNVYTGIVPYYSSEEATVTLSESVIWSEHKGDYPVPMAKAVDFTADFETTPTESQLRSRATSYISSSNGWQLGESTKISFVSLADTEEYKDVATLQRVNLCDTIKVVTDLGEEIEAEVVSVDYDVLAERYTSVEVGTAQTNLTQAIAESIGIGTSIPTKSNLEQALERATSLISGGLGGYVVLKPNANGEPEEILIMDTPDINTAQNVIRMNRNGIAFSTNGYDPASFDMAWTIDGELSATFITGGVLDATVLRAGVIRDQAGENWWNLDTGEMHINAESYIDTSNLVTRAELDVAADQIATEVVAQVGSGIFFNCIPIDNDNNTTTIQAHLYANRLDITTDYEPMYYQWYKKTEDGKEYLGYGYEITVNHEDYGYGGEVEAVFSMLESRTPSNSQGRWVFAMFGAFYGVLLSQGQLAIQQGRLNVLSHSELSTNVYPVFGYDYM